MEHVGDRVRGTPFRNSTHALRDKGRHKAREIRVLFHLLFSLVCQDGRCPP